mmetsp:Transcript_14024/g.33090  ORF Transcript_14024/g.33090 Transcript_14024/m.33090 type:complete len:104 (+) Transcript_14024:308-619(+)
MPPRCSPRTSLYSPPASCSHPQCCTACAASVTRRIFAVLRHSLFTAAPLTTAPLAHHLPLAPLAHRGAARLRDHRSLRRSHGVSSLTVNRRAARHLTARAPPH